MALSRLRTLRANERTARVMLIAVVCAPIVLAAIRAVRRGWFPIGDSALLYIRAADVGTSHHPWLGSWTSASLSVGTDMNNPGAMYDWLMAPFSRTLAPGPGAAFGVAAVNVACVIGIALASRYVGGRRFESWMLAAAAGLTWTMGSELLFDIWQAHALLLPFLLFLVLLTGCTLGKTGCMPYMLATGSLLVQTHISYAYILSLLGIAAIALRWSAGRSVPLRDRLRGIDRRRAGVSAGVVAVLWLPTIGEQLFSAGQGNLSRLASSLGKGELALGADNAVRAVGAVYTLPRWWLRSGFSTTVVGTPRTQGPDGPSIELLGLPGVVLAVTGLALGTALLIWLARGAGSARATAGQVACALAAVLLPASVLCLTVLTVGPGGLAPHHVRWLWAAAVFVHFAALHELARRLGSRRAATDRPLRLVPVVAAVLFALAAVPFHAAPEGPVADRAVEPNLREVFARLEPLREHQPIRYRTDNLRVYEPYSSAVMMRLQELGIEFRVEDPGMIRQLGDTRRSVGDEEVEVFQLEAVPAMQYTGPACPLAYTSLVSGDAGVQAEQDAAWAADALRRGDIYIIPGAELTAEDAALMTAAGQGDESAIVELVYRGVLSRLLADGLVGVNGRDAAQLLAEMRVVDQWIATTFALFANLPAPCPQG